MNETLKLAQKVSKAGAWDWDIIHNSFYWSEEFLKLFEMNSETEAGFKAWMNTVHPEDTESATEKIQDAINNKKQLVNDYRIILSDQKIRWIRAIGKTFYDENKPVRMLGLCLDVSEQKQVEDALRQTKEAAEAANG